LGGMGGSGALGGMGGSGAVGGMGGSGALGGMGGSGALGGMGGSGAVGGMGGSGATGGTTGNTVACGTDKCDPEKGFCCQHFTGGAYQATCYTSSQTCYGADIKCDGPEDCGSGQICCGTLVQNGGGSGYYTDFSCKNSCNYAGARVVCGSSPGVCPSGTTCKGSSILPQYKICTQN
ncbi:MAG: hypothetical protein L6Q84_32355, partial [Polyangiaceae bacterium]|nr:hypothetical protein [Polyangiaceae bacterium]